MYLTLTFYISLEIHISPKHHRGAICLFQLHSNEINVMIIWFKTIERVTLMFVLMLYLASISLFSTKTFCCHIFSFHWNGNIFISHAYLHFIHDFLLSKNKVYLFSEYDKTIIFNYVCIKMTYIEHEIGLFFSLIEIGFRHTQLWIFFL